MPGSSSDSEEWARDRREVVQAHVDRLARARAAETVRALQLVAEFAAEATRRGLVTRPLLSPTADRPPTYRTRLTGWYLTRDGSIAVTTDGGYHVMTTRASLRGRLRGVTIRPTDPPLQVGAGARDGESIALDTLLAQRLEAGDDWPIHGL